MLKKILSYLTRKLIILTCFLISACSNSQETPPMLPGAYQLGDYIPAIQNRKVGLVINHASKIGSSNLIDTLLSEQINVLKIFTPEHGFSGKADAGASVLDDKYSDKQIPVISLYGNRRKPTVADLDGLDILVFDLQDVGVRFYTYISTLHYIMEACAENNIPLIVLDRPNPNGHYVDGPVLKEKYHSFVGMHQVPTVYGMSIGEYARMINGENWLANSVHCKLEVVKCQNYSHRSYYTLPIAPSPNLSSMRAIYLYPSTGFFEGTIVSEGRGTEAPFQLIGHPDFSDKSVAFTPKSIPGASMNPKLKEMECYGIDLRKTSIDSLRGGRKINLEYLIQFYTDLNLGEKFFIDYIDLLAGTDEFRKQILDGNTADEIRASWQNDLEEFKKIRAKYLLYPDFD